MSVKVTKKAIKVDIRLDICGPISTRKGHRDNDLIRVGLKSRQGRYKAVGDNRGDEVPSLCTNGKSLSRLTSPDILGNIEIYITCPVCSKIHYSYGKYVTLYYTLVELINVTKYTGVLVCSGECRELFELSPISYEKNYYDSEISVHPQTV